MQQKRFKYWNVFWVVIFVYLFFGFMGFIAASVAPQEQQIDMNKLFTWRSFFTHVFCVFYLATLYYYTSNTFYRLIEEKRNTVIYLKVIVLTAIALGIYFAASYFMSGQQPAKEINAGILVFAFSFSTIFQVALAIVIPYLIYLRDEKKQRKILEAQKMQLEIEKSQANFNFLKSQINPHFLHNTLNFLYSKALPLSPELSEGILTLSDIMRYALDEGNTLNGKAPLKDEIEHVRNVIKIQQLRFNNNLNVKFNVEGIVNSATIIPFVLITLVENAFKHGDLKDDRNPINIRLEVSRSKLYFFCSNKKKTGTKELSTGIGLNNIKTRLELAYGKNYRFDVKDEDELYTTELFIELL